MSSVIEQTMSKVMFKKPRFKVPEQPKDKTTPMDSLPIDEEIAAELISETINANEIAANLVEKMDAYLPDLNKYKKDYGLNS